MLIMASPLLSRTHLSTRRLRVLIRLFAVEVPATRAAREIGVHRHTAERVYTVIHQAMMQACETETRLEGDIEVDESYFGGIRKQLRGRAVQGKVVVFGLLKRRGLMTKGYRHYRINHSKAFATGRRQHINGIENFWGYAKTQLKRDSGIPRTQFWLYLKEMEFRFNHRHED